jgi:hypothetical protein
MRYVIILLIVLLFLAGCGQQYSRESVDEFAKCLTENGVVMYGTFWCPHCANVKKDFGESFRHINYIECDPRGDDEQAELCIEKDIQEYATFEFSDGSRLVGEPNFEELGGKTGCEIL